MSGSSIHAAVTALYETYSAAKPQGWSVGDGRPYDQRSTRFLAVAWAGLNETAVESDVSDSDIARRQAFQTIRVACMLSMWSGEGITSSVRAAAFSAFDTFDAALAADRKLGGAASSARAVDVELVPGQWPEGVLAQVMFTVEITVYK